MKRNESLRVTLEEDGGQERSETAGQQSHENAQAALFLFLSPVPGMATPTVE
jgi:hypothetical protein